MTFRIQKMPRLPENYFRYFAATPDTAVWGLGVTASGLTRVSAGSPYPPACHPPDHQLDWSRGRVLEAMQIVLIAGGRGLFETRATGLCTIVAGEAFALLPGVWHRYRPDPETGWEESWVELPGPMVDRLLASGTCTPEKAVRRGALTGGLDEALAMVHARSRRGPPGFSPARAAAAFAALGAWAESVEPPPASSGMARVVDTAERYLADHHTEPVNVAELARRLGVAYSHFRRAFRARTGFAPWQYVVHLRLARARRMLASGDATLAAIASELGFSSAFHFSTAFKQAFGTAPEHWRRRLSAKH